MGKGCVLLAMTACAGCSPSNGGTTGNPQGNAGAQDVVLAPPPPGEGFQFATGAFEVPAGVEQQDCYFFQVPGEGSEPVFVKRIVVAQNAGSHHMNIFRVKTIAGLGPEGGLVQRARDGVGECYGSPNWADWPLVINSQQGGSVEWDLPQGVAHRFAPGEWLMLQTHYVNATTQTTPGRGLVMVNFLYAAASDVTAELGTLFGTKQSIRVCQADTSPRFEGSCQFNSTQPVHIVGANGHFHSRGRRFEMYAWDGRTTTSPPQSDLFYESESWDDPPMSRSPELDRVVPAGGGVWYSCEYEWEPPPGNIGCDGLDRHDQTVYGTREEDLDCCYTFGGVVEKSEHCNIFVYYYPKVDHIGCF